MSMIRKIMRNVMRKYGAKRTPLSGVPAVGSQRAGMHQASEHEYRHAVMANGGPEPETPEEALEMPDDLESEIPPEEINDDQAEIVAEETAVIVPEEKILDEIADPEASQLEEKTEDDTNAQLSVDYSGERIPEMTPPVSSGVSPYTELIYSPGDGSMKEIQEPLPGLGERFGIPPKIDGVENPSANVAAYDPPEPEPEPDPETPAEETPAEVPGD